MTDRLASLLSRAQLEAGLAEVAAGPDDAALRRILALPRRREVTPDEVALVSSALRVRPDPVCPAGPEAPDGSTCRRCNGTGRIMLYPEQASAIVETHDMRGFAGALGVGVGKTLIALVLPTVLRSERPVLMIPAALREKTLRDFNRYRLDWRVRLPAIVSYEEMGRADRATKLDDLAPDLLVLDEADFARNMGAAVTRRIRRCIETHRPVFVPMSGTLIGEELMDAWHFLAWALGERAPVPLERSDAERWAAAVDRDLGSRRPVAEGELASIPGGFHAWLRGSRGVLAASSSDCDASISIRPWSPPLPPALAEIVDMIGRTRKRPDGEPLDDFDIPDYQCQVAQGFFYVWDPMPPDWWLQPRRAWNMYANAVHEAELDGLDSRSQIVAALDHGHAPEDIAPTEGRELLRRWREVATRFEPNPIPVWLDNEPLRQVLDHARRSRCIVWTAHKHAGYELARLGLPYYGGGSDPEQAPAGHAMAVSYAAHKRGANLQAWDRMLFLRPPASVRGWEQAIGREHRRGQRSPHVGVEYLSTIAYHEAVVDRVLARAKKFSTATGFEHKMLLADWL